MMGPVVEELSETNSDIKVCKLDIDESPDVASKYGVMAVPTFIVFENGEESKKDVGAIGREQLAAMVG